MKINNKNRIKAQNVVREVLKNTYFSEGVPIDNISEALYSVGIVMVMEDNTEWSGFFCGSEGEAFINLAPINSMVTGEGNFEDISFYIPYINVGLRLTWYKCSSRLDGKFEVI